LWSAVGHPALSSRCFSRCGTDVTM
jgi:hypothetical protein